MNDATWAALVVSLTLLLALGTGWAFRRRGPAAGMRGLALTVLPSAAWLTGTLQLITEIAASILSWASGVVFNPFVWTGIGLFGLSGALLLVAGRVRARSGRPAGVATAASDRSAAPVTRQPDAAPATRAVDDEMADIEAILRKRGIS
ncbi:MAG: hypothetical protein ACRCYU_05080 [Nocardioides sp.]